MSNYTVEELIARWKREELTIEQAIGQIMLLQPFMIVALALPVNGEPIDIETILFAAAVVTTVLIGQRMRVERR